MGKETLKQLQCFFGTVAGQSDRTLQDLADEEDLDLDEEAGEAPKMMHWHKSRRTVSLSLRLREINMYDECITMALYDYDVWNESMQYCNIPNCLIILILYVYY